MENCGDYTRAAGIAVFNLMIPRAIKCFRTGASADIDAGGDPNYNSIAMALSGYTSERNSLWRDMCQELLSHFTKPYLKAIFAFLTAVNESYDEILVNILIF